MKAKQLTEHQIRVKFLQLLDCCVRDDDGGPRVVGHDPYPPGERLSFPAHQVLNFDEVRDLTQDFPEGYVRLVLSENCGGSGVTCTRTIKGPR